MKSFKPILGAFALLITATFSSCLGDDDDNTLSQGSGSDFANLTSLDGASATFTVTTVEDKTVNIYCNEGTLINPQTYPIGSRLFITYGFQPGQDTNLPVKVTLKSVRPVATIPAESAPAADCKLDYPAFVIAGQPYLAGPFINLQVNINRGTNRVWKCLINEETSKGDVANLYLTYTETSYEPIGTAEYISIDVSAIKVDPHYKEINLHLNCSLGTGYTLRFPTKK